MNFKVDPAFQKSGQHARKRRKKRQRNRIDLRGGIGAGLLAAVAGLFFLWPAPREGHESHESHEAVLLDEEILAEEAAEPGDGFVMVQSASSATLGASLAEAAFIDLAGDPLILNFEQSGDATRQTLNGPAELDPARIGLPEAERLVLIQDSLVQAEARLVIRIPSTREDFAYFQTKRSQGIEALQDAETEVRLLQAAAEGESTGELVSIDGSDGSWGALINTGAEGQSLPDKAVFVETVIENTTSVAFLLHEAQRNALFHDIVVVLQRERSLADVLMANGFEEDVAQRIVKAAEREIGPVSALPAAGIVALRVREMPGAEQKLLQMSLYDPRRYRASLARVGAGRYALSADPWGADDLLTTGAGMQSQASGPMQDVRLLDALYSAGIRNGLSTSLVGELIVAMAQLYDLDRIAAEGDKVTILHARDAAVQAAGIGAILFVSIEGPSGNLACYIAPKPNREGFTCFGQNGRGGGSAGGLGGGLIVPVSGTRTSPFGPRMHPILRQLRNHNGVDWAAPTGTPIYAAAAGKVIRAGVAGGYGNVVFIDHGNGMETRYAHMDRFAPLGRVGARVQAGDQIGFVGTTGRSTGPHLHFEVRLNGRPVDPLSFRGTGAAGATVAAGGAGVGAVDALVNKIIKVESAGRADARNPMSTATGLGQFINSTWLRMMRTYRPDLVQSLSQAELLALRTNPELSREMVANLARENEAFLRSKGHQITAGRLYLAHFLGPQGAHTALRSSPDATVLAVMGAAVVNANSFLKGWSVSQMTAWADRKMSGAGGGRVAAAPVMTPELRAYMKLIDGIIAEI